MAAKKAVKKAKHKARPAEEQFESEDAPDTGDTDSGDPEVRLEADSAEVFHGEADESVHVTADDGVETPPCPLLAKVGALLFVSTRPLTAETLADAANVKVESVERELKKLAPLFTEEKHGFALHEVAGGWQFRTNAGAAPSIQRLIPRSARRLTRAAAETLAVIAYRQPVQRAEVETIRGVDALPTLKTLLDARLIRIVGRGEAAGQPALYGTTQTFLEKFGLSDLSELPTPRELTELMKEPGDVPDFEEEFEVESAEVQDVQEQTDAV